MQKVINHDKIGVTIGCDVLTQIKSLRKARGITQQKLASALNVSRTTVTMWEIGSHEPDYSTVVKIAEYFQVPTDYLLGAGVFSNWDEIRLFKDILCGRIIKDIPPGFSRSQFTGGKYLDSWLLENMMYNYNEIRVINWFSYAVKKVSFGLYNDVDYGSDYQHDSYPPMDIKIEYTPQFSSALKAYEGGEETSAKNDTDSVRGAIGLNTVRIPVLGKIPAGIPLEAIEDIIDYEEIPQSLLSGGREYFALEVKGDSMWPDYLPGDVVIVRKQPVCNSGDDCIVYVNGYDATLKQVRLNEADHSLTIVPRNQSYPPRTYTQEEIQTLPVTIAGVIVELRRKIKK